MRSTLLAALVLIGLTVSGFAAQHEADEKVEAGTTIIPAHDEVARIAKATTVSFAKALRAKDFKPFYATLSPEFQAKVTYADFEARYGEFLKRHADIMAVENANPEFNAQPSLTRSGRMHISGFFRLSNGRVDFTYEYFQRSEGWRLAGMHVLLDTTQADAASVLAQLRMRAEKGDADAQLNLGLRLHDGTGAQRNDAEAVQWYRKSAEGGNTMAQVMLGYALLNGQGIAKDAETGIAWYNSAAQSGNPHAQRYLGVAYAEGAGVPKDEGQAAAWFRKAAEQGDLDSQTLYAAMLEEGIGVRQDLAASAIWWRKAADQGDSDARKHLEKLQRSAKTN